jgi:hypothetical protein
MGQGAGLGRCVGLPAPYCFATGPGTDGQRIARQNADFSDGSSEEWGGLATCPGMAGDAQEGRVAASPSEQSLIVTNAPDGSRIATPEHAAFPVKAATGACCHERALLEAGGDGAHA